MADVEQPNTDPEEAGVTLIFYKKEFIVPDNQAVTPAVEDYLVEESIKEGSPVLGFNYLGEYTYHFYFYKVSNEENMPTTDSSFLVSPWQVLSWVLVTLAGSNNTAEATVESELTGQLNQVEAILRREQGESSFVLLGEDSNGMRIMVKEYVGTGSINSVRVEYPAQFRDSYEASATAIIDSLEPGNLEQSF